jgi:hypothetical protein
MECVDTVLLDGTTLMIQCKIITQKYLVHNQSHPTSIIS